MVVGTVIGPKATSKPDTWKIAVQPDNSQYEKNLWTKDAALVQQMMNRLGQRFSFMCGVSHWNNAQNQPVRSLWVNGVSEAPAPGAVEPIGQAVLGQLPQQVPQVPQQVPQALPQAQGTVVPLPQPQQAQAQPVETDRELRIMRQAASKAATAMIDSLSPESRTFPKLVEVAEGWLRYYTHGPAGIVGFAATPSPQGVEQPQPLSYEQPQQPGQFAADDIPF